MPPFPYVGNLDLSKIHCAPMVQEGNKKSVPLFLDASATTNQNRVWFQMCPDEDTPLTTRYALDSVHQDQDGSRRGLGIVVDHPDTVRALQTFDDAIVQAAVANSKDWFKKLLTEEQVRMRYKPLLTRDADDDPWVMKIKVKCGPAKVPTKIIRKVDGKAKRSNEDDLAYRGAKIVPLVSAYALWFMGGGDGKFGASFQCEEMLVTPAAPPSLLSNFTLKRPLELEEEDDEQEAKCPKVELVCD